MQFPDKKISTFPYPKNPCGLLSTTRRIRTYGQTYGDVITNFLGWIVYQILLPMVLRCNQYTVPDTVAVEPTFAAFL